MIYVGINGFGRIGKSIFLQLLHDKDVQIKCINCVTLDLKHLKSYLSHDSVHHYDTNFDISYLNESEFEITFQNRTHHIQVFRDRDAKKLNWRDFNVNIVLDCTGSYLTTEKCLEHNVDYVMMSSPPKDKTPTFVYGVNHEQYKDEKIISAASCTTNCITPVLKWFNDKLKIVEGNFTTIHATTASQYTVDIFNKNVRTERSILNNIIPHTTGASSAISAVIPELKGKINGTSLRVPVSNVSLVDLNLVCEETKYSFNEVMDLLRKDLDKSQKEIIEVTNENLVSCDFMTTVKPSIIDSKASINLGPGKFKLMIWYDNEWSYAAQMIRLMKHVMNKNLNSGSYNYQKHSIDNIDFKNKDVLIRVDMNVPLKNGKISDDYRITSSLPTIFKILEKGANKILLVTHLGRPDHKKSWEENVNSSSTKILLEKLEFYLKEPVTFLGFENMEKNLQQFKSSTSRIFLLENIRFHAIETEFGEMYEEDLPEHPVYKPYFQFADIYINDAFGCSHRNHMSISEIGEYKERPIQIGYGYLIKKEIDALEKIVKNPEKKNIMLIIGGSKLDDKIPILKSLSRKVKTIFLCGGCVNSLVKDTNGKLKEVLDEVKNNCNLVIMNDGKMRNGMSIEWNENFALKEIYNFEGLSERTDGWSSLIEDIGMNSLSQLLSLINEHDLIFWNGTLGRVEIDSCKMGSELLVKYLMNSGKDVIVGGGDTAGFVNKYNHKFTHVCTGGGASLEYLGSYGYGLIGTEMFFK